MATMDYPTLSLAQVTADLDAVVRDAQETFGALDAKQLNWRPDATQWSAAQCFDHLLTVNRQMLRKADEALDRSTARTIWQRLPVLSGLWGRMLIQSQAPGGARKYKAPPDAQPAASGIAADVVQRFVAQQRDAASRARALDEKAAAAAIMTSPFAGFITYSVLDGWRLMVAHNRRHVEQARRVVLSPGFSGR
jgi:DinB superfamily